MTKDTRLTFRVDSSLKKDLEMIAAREGRSVAQVCDVFLRAALDMYMKNGAKFIQRFLSRQKNEASE